MSKAEQVVENLLGADSDFTDPKELVNAIKAEQDAEVAALRAQGAVSPKTVGQGSVIYHRTIKNSDGTAARAKVTSVKLWKTRPDYFEIGWKHGLKTYGSIKPHSADEWTTIEPPRETVKRRR